MKIDSVKLAYFSPTGTTSRVVHGIATGLASEVMEWIDLTKPESRNRPLSTSEGELLVLAVPVYMGRVPELLDGWLNAIRANGTPTVCVVVYGNRVYDNALLELRDVATRRGCIPVACAAYIGEHSFSDPETPIAQGRPDKNDLDHAEKFGRRIREKLQSVPTVSEIQSVTVPGTYPYGGITKLWDVDFIEVSNLCAQCGVCADLCPVGAIDSADSSVIDKFKCITCCACIKACPKKARVIKQSPVKDAANRLNQLYKEPKKPEYFL